MFAHPRPKPARIDYRSIEPRFEVWGWRVRADPARALEFLELQAASRHGLTLTGSGTTRVTTPPFFRGREAVEVVTGGSTPTVRPGPAGRLSFTVELGLAHTVQQDTSAPAAAGYFTSRTVRFVR